MSEVSEGKGKSNWGGLIPTGMALATALFAAMGFLATRSYLSGIGIPEHVNIPVDGYIQYGGRFFFVLAVHFVPVSVCAGFLFIIGFGLAHWLTWVGRLAEKEHFVCLVLAVAASATIFLDLASLQSEPVFSPGHVRDVPGQLLFKLYFIEVGTAISVAWLVSRFGDLWRNYRNTLFQKTLFSIALLMVLVEVLLLPVCFGQIAMVPKSFDRVTLRRENEQTNLNGILVFSSADNYFVFTGDRKLVEVPHHTVKEIQYESRESLEKLAKR